MLISMNDKGEILGSDNGLGMAVQHGEDLLEGSEDRDIVHGA
jgi:hypothetical protein